ncbi:MAG: nicotinate-nucleotide--dimethylbenzimidazole phosphoribosyltransferase [Firmicutes bacterium]|nr:nicotinate-nucleotide--dimethylbenzimidazole phosphoribosyltransferase [Bacillota bacterium]
MTRNELCERIAEIKPLDEEAMAKARARQLKLAKPPGSLGRLEDIAVRLSGISGLEVFDPSPALIAVFCSDNGVTEEGVSSAPSSVTAAQAVNMTKGLTGMSAMAARFGDRVRVVDVGISNDHSCHDIIDMKIARGTRNFAKGPAMTEEQCLKAIEAGFKTAEDAAKEGAAVFGCGEMGIGNTATSAAVLSALTGLSPDEVTGRGGGLTDEAFDKKKRVIKEALANLEPDPEDPIDVLTKVGGFDLAAMCGFFLGAAALRRPVVIDGFISIVAALCAARLCPAAKGFMLPSHSSREKGFAAAAKELGLKPYLDLDMRLGEGSGCVLAFRLIEASCAFTGGMADFEKASIDDAYLEEIRKKERFGQ